MKNNKTISKLHIPFVVMIFVSLACIVTALCLCDYNFNGAFADIWQANMPSFILAGASVALDLALIIAAIVLRVKNNELTRAEVGLAFMIVILLLLEVVFCVPIFLMWVIESIHDAVSKARREKI